MGGVREVAYRALASDLREAIKQGKYSEGDALPTEAALAASRGLSRSTVRRAMQELVAEGVIYRVPGRGTFPMSGGHDRYLRHVGSVEDLMGLSTDTMCEVISPLQRRIDIDAAGRLHLTSDFVYTVTVRRLFGSQPFSLTTVTVRPEIGDLLTGEDDLRITGRVSRVTVLGLIEKARPNTIVDAEQTITAVAAPSSAANHLGCHAGDPVLRIDRLYSDGDGTPVELAVSYFDPNYYSYRVKLRR